jgi:hypothetical protein
MPGLFCERARAPDFNGERIARSKPRSGMRHPQTRQGRPPLLSIFHSDVLSELAPKRIYFLLDIVDFGQRPKPRSSKHEFQIEQLQSRKS